ncbi:MAG: hypothetical protein QOG21_238 [Actinomycetota bacterium]|nr:hypothetical protein [Actinomycetota bacterium]
MAPEGSSAIRTVSGRPSPSTSPRREPGLVRPGVARTAASLLQPSSDAADAVGEGEGDGVPDGVRVRDGEGVTESRDVVEPAPTDFASLLLQAASPTRQMAAIAT